MVPGFKLVMLQRTEVSRLRVSVYASPRVKVVASQLANSSTISLYLFPTCHLHLATCILSFPTFPLASCNFHLTHLIIPHQFKTSIRFRVYRVFLRFKIVLRCTLTR
jgi:hypothetical protein